MAIAQMLLLPVSDAQQVSKSNATQVAITTMQYEGIDAQNLVVDTVFALIESGDTLLYEVCFENGEIVFLSGNKSCVPVLGFCIPENGDNDEQINSLDFNNEENPDGLICMLNSYAEQIRHCFNYNLINTDCQNEWDDLQIYDEHNLHLRNEVSPLIETKWGQTRSNDIWPLWDGHAYNYYVTNVNINCDEGNYCPVGCTAIAMSQIMRKWGEPSEIPSVCEQYDWNNMSNKLIKTLNTNFDVERNAIAKLAYDCSQKVGAMYCYGGNCGTFILVEDTYKVLDALRDDFGYCEDMVLKSLSEMSYVAWENLIISDLENGCPIFYVGVDPNNGGHDFVCDGYKGYYGIQGNQFHFNWGRLGKKDGWFRIKNLSPGSYDYTAQQQAIFHIRPTDCWENIIMQCNKIFAGNVPKYYSAQNRFSNNYHTYVINSGASVHLQAGEDILLTDGFYAAEDSEFTAIIAPCGNSRGEGGYLSELSDERVQQEIERTNQISSSISPLEMVIFPNPVTGTFSIRINNPSEKVTFVEVFNMMGGVVLKDDNAHDNIDVSVLHKGMYVVRVKCSSGNVYYGKFVKE